MFLIGSQKRTSLLQNISADSPVLIGRVIRQTLLSRTTFLLCMPSVPVYYIHNGNNGFG